MARVRESLAQRVAAAIARSIEDTSDRILPPLAQLRREHNVSIGTVTQAVHILRGRGLLEFHQGKRIKVVRGDVETTPQHGTVSTPRKSSTERLYSQLRSRIENGAYRAGSHLPKQEYFVREFHVTMRTVAGAYARLAADGMIRKKGKAWVAGSCDSSRVDIQVSTRPVIVLITRDELFWRDHIQRSARVSRFGTAFDQEVERFGVEIASLVLKPVLGVTLSIFSQGLDAFPALENRLDNRYIGTLVAGSRSEIPILQQVIDRCIRFHRPVVWFDRYDEADAPQCSSSLYTRCHFSERRAVTEAVHLLVDSGHETIGYLSWRKGNWEPWMTARVELLREVSGRANKDLRIITYKTPASPEEILHEREILAFVDRMRQRDCPLLANFRRATAAVDAMHPALARQMTALPLNDIRSRIALLIRFCDINGQSFIRPIGMPFEAAISLTPYMLRYLRHEDLTALVVASDESVPHLYGWLQFAGYDVPGQVSLVSFDNTAGKQPYRITSVDMGFDYLGYSAFHSILGDIPFKRSAKGDIASGARVVQRGTFDRPSKRRGAQVDPARSNRCRSSPVLRQARGSADS